MKNLLGITVALLPSAVAVLAQQYMSEEMIKVMIRPPVNRDVRVHDDHINDRANDGDVDDPIIGISSDGWSPPAISTWFVG